MRAVALDYRQRRLLQTELPPPRLQRDDQVLFRVREVGVCGTDRELAAFRLGFPPAGESLLVLGHEALGQVVEAGPAVTTLSPGDWVAPMIRRACSPPCPSCARGRRDLCVSSQSLERGIFGLHGYCAEYALDAAEDLVRVPENLLDCAVLIEPLSVVEKALQTALRFHEPGPASALVLGAGPIGLLAALALQVRGLDTSVYSLEPADHPRARLARDAGLRYVTMLGTQKADIVIEATGAPEAALAALRCLAPLGVCAVLGAANTTGPIPFMDLLVNNQTVFGSVNASPQAFRAALEDLLRFDRAILNRMIRRRSLSELPQTLPSPAPDSPKTVHVVS
jgi:threonine dehydrogenase-like Zn-dependent dehydrogenase